MKMGMKIRQLTVQEYEEFLKQRTHVNFLQSVMEYRKLQSDNQNKEIIGFVDEDVIYGAGILVYTRYAKLFYKCYVPRGFVFDYKDKKRLEEATVELKKYLKKKKVAVLTMDPDIVLNYRDRDGNVIRTDHEVEENLKSTGYIQLPLTSGYDYNWQCRFVSVLDLKDKSEDEMFEEFPYHTKRHIRCNEKYCVKTRELGRKDLPILDEMEKKTCERQKFESMDLDYYKQLYDAFGEDRVKLVYSYLDIEEYGTRIQSEFHQISKNIVVTRAFLEKNPGNTKKETKLMKDLEYYDSLEKKLNQIDTLRERYGNEVPLSCALFIHYNNEMIYLVGASEYEHRMFKGPYATQWYMIRKAIELGCTRYNFYGISGCFKPDEEGYGVFDFKRGFNATVEEYIGNFVLPVKPAVFRLYESLRNNHM